MVECGEPVHHPKCQLVTMQLPGNHCDQNVILISSSALHWAVIIGNVAEMSSEIDLCIWDCPACFTFFHGTGRRPSIDVDVAITLFILIVVDVAIILFINTVYTS